MGANVVDVKRLLNNVESRLMISGLNTLVLARIISLSSLCGNRFQERNTRWHDLSSVSAHLIEPIWCIVARFILFEKKKCLYHCIVVVFCTHHKHQISGLE